MSRHILDSLLAILLLGGAAQWLAWLLRLPAIMLLLVFGFLAGPIVGLIQPDQLFADLLLPLVSFSVALILFEGGLSLDLRELRGSGAVVRNLVSVGALATWAVAALAARYIIGLDTGLAVLLGAIVIVTGPTVVLPLLRYVKPIGPVGPILKWEGIVIDPVGAITAVLVFEIVLTGTLEHAALHLPLGLVKTFGIGGGLGLLAATVLVIVIWRNTVPHHLHAIVTVMIVLGTHGLANVLQTESGLVAVTVMGIALANQRRIDVSRIAEFKENLRVFLISGLFIVLSARLRLEDLALIGPEIILFVAVLVFIARPLCVAVSTAGSKLGWAERVFLMWMAPRGIVAAAVASVFALALEDAGYRQARLLLPITFVTIVCTVAWYGLTVSIVGRRLRLAERDPQGLLIVGAHPFARALADAVQAADFRVLLVDTNRSYVTAAQMAGLPAVQADVLAADLLEKIDLAGIGRLLALTPNEEVNILAAQRFERLLGQPACHRLPSKSQAKHHLPGVLLFSPSATYGFIDQVFRMGGTIKTTRLTSEFDYAQFCGHYGKNALPLFLHDRGRLVVIPAAGPPVPKAGNALISLVWKDSVE